MIKLQKAKNKQLYFTVHSRNGQVLVTSETYKSRRGAVNGMTSLARIMAMHSNSNAGSTTVAFEDLTKAK